MKDYRAAMLQALVAVAWADQALHAREVEVIEALIAAFGVTDAEAAIVREYAKTPRTLDDIPLSELSSEDRHLLVSHAVLLSYADGDPAASEQRVIADLLARLHITDEQAAPLLAAARARAERLAAQHNLPRPPVTPEQDA